MNKLSIYYFIIAAILIGKTATTLYQRSVVVHHGHSVLSLQKEKQSLAEKQLALTAQLSNVTSLASIENSDSTQGYETISSPLVLTTGRVTAFQL